MDNKKRTLIELITKNLIEINTKKINKKNIKKTRKSNTIRSKIPSISAILINSETKKIKHEDKEEKSKEEDLEGAAEEEPDNKRKIMVNSGYGTISKHYGMSPVVKYADYSRIWGHLGKFKAYSSYGDAETSHVIAVNNGESAREMVSTETIEKAAKHFKYFVRGELTGDIGYVPPVGLNVDSKEWEKYRLMSLMSIYQPLLKLKWSTA